jgi:hypothetical protein
MRRQVLWIGNDLKHHIEVVEVGDDDVLPVIGELGDRRLLSAVVCGVCSGITRS